MARGIAFSRSISAAEADKLAFEHYAQGKITLTALCKRLAFNNGLEEVTEEQALYEYEATGWKHIAETGNKI